MIIALLEQISTVQLACGSLVAVGAMAFMTRLAQNWLTEPSDVPQDLSEDQDAEILGETVARGPVAPPRAQRLQPVARSAGETTAAAAAGLLSGAESAASAADVSAPVVARESESASAHAPIQLDRTAVVPASEPVIARGPEETQEIPSQKPEDRKLAPFKPTTNWLDSNGKPFDPYAPIPVPGSEAETVAAIEGTSPLSFVKGAAGGLSELPKSAVAPGDGTPAAGLTVLPPETPTPATPTDVSSKSRRAFELPPLTVPGADAAAAKSESDGKTPEIPASKIEPAAKLGNVPTPKSESRVKLADVPPAADAPAPPRRLFSGIFSKASAPAPSFAEVSNLFKGNPDEKKAVDPAATGTQAPAEAKAEPAVPVDSKAETLASGADATKAGPAGTPASDDSAPAGESAESDDVKKAKSPRSGKVDSKGPRQIFMPPGVEEGAKPVEVKESAATPEADKSDSTPAVAVAEGAKAEPPTGALTASVVPATPAPAASAPSKTTSDKAPADAPKLIGRPRIFLGKGAAAAASKAGETPEAAAPAEVAAPTSEAEKPAEALVAAAAAAALAPLAETVASAFEAKVEPDAEKPTPVEAKAEPESETPVEAKAEPESEKPVEAKAEPESEKPVEAKPEDEKPAEALAAAAAVLTPEAVAEPTKAAEEAPQEIVPAASLVELAPEPTPAPVPELPSVAPEPSPATAHSTFEHSDITPEPDMASNEPTSSLTPTGRASAQLTLGFEVTSLQLTPFFKLGAVQLRPLSNVVALHLIGAQPENPLAAGISFQIERVELDGNTHLKSLLLKPLGGTETGATPSPKLQVDAVQLTQAGEGSSIQITPSGQASTAVHLLGTFIIAAMEFTPAFEIGSLRLEPTSNSVLLRLAPSQRPTAIDLPPAFDVSAVELSDNSQISSVRLTPSGAKS